MKGSRRKQEGNDKIPAGRPSRSIKKRRGRGKQVEKEQVKEEIQKQPVDDIKFNKKVMSDLEKSGAVNYLLAKMFTQLSIYANQRQRKRYLISSDYKSLIKSKNNIEDNDYSDDYNDDEQERNKNMHLIASRIVFEYLIDHRLKLTNNALQNETRNDKAFSSKTPASFSPLQLDEDEEEDDYQESNIIKKIILANKKSGLTAKPPKRNHNKGDEIQFNIPEKTRSQLKRKNSLNSDFSFISVNSNLVIDKTSESNQDPLEKIEEEEINEEISESSKKPDSPVSPKRRPAPPLPSTTSPKRQKSSSIQLTSPSKTTTPSKLKNSNELSSGYDSEHSYSSSNIEVDDNDIPNNLKIYKPQSPTHAKNEINSIDLSINSGELNFTSIPNLNPISKSTSSQAAEELPMVNQNNLSEDDSLNESSGSEHELEAEDDYFSEKDDE